MIPMLPGTEKALEKLDAVERVLVEATLAERAARRKLLEYCPYKPGDDAVANVFSYSGKTFRIFSISVRKAHNPETRRPGYQWILWGRVLRQNGEPGKLEAERREFFT